MKVIELKGQGASPYYANGKARVITSEKDLEQTKEDDILIVVNSTPLMVPYLAKAKGFVAERGGLLSHICIVAREFEKPCVCHVKEARSIIKNGENLEIDGRTGIVKILRRD